MILDLLQDLLEDADVFSYIKHGTYSNIYDNQAKYISERLSKDISIIQIQNIMWDAFYEELCVGVVPGDENIKDELFVLDKQSAAAVMGTASRFEPIASMIRHMVEY